MVKGEGKVFRIIRNVTESVSAQICGTPTVKKVGSN